MIKRERYNRQKDIHWAERYMIGKKKIRKRKKGKQQKIID